MILYTLISSVIRQKGESQNGCFKKTKHAKFFKKTPNISYPLIRTRTCAYQGVRNVHFSENLPYYRRFQIFRLKLVFIKANGIVSRS